MHAEKIEISNEDIKYAESILLSNEESFNQERIDFIKNLETIDLHAVPGSGKTTALLAKLLILERKLPFDDGSGILVLSHTNTAVNEVKNRIGKYCPKLFSYPNFIGTIQSFVDTFLAIPYYEKIKKKRIISIDSEVYKEAVEKFYNRNKKSMSYINKQYDPMGLLSKIRFNNNWDLRSDNVKLPTKHTTTYKLLKRMKESIFNDGIITYDEAYFLAEKYLKEVPKIKNLIILRFKYIFVDEMQDMEETQYTLLEELFYDSGVKYPTYQRIGDNNQAIYNYKVKTKSIWKERNNSLSINGTYRFNNLLANLVSRFAINGISIKSLRNQTSSIKNIMLVYEDEKVECEVIEKFLQIIKKVEENKNLYLSKYPIKLVAWRKDISNKEKIALSSYCPNFEKENIKKDIFDNLNDYMIHISENHQNYNDIYNIILKAIIKACRIDDIKIEDKIISKTRLKKYLESVNLINWSNSKLYECCNLIISDKIKEAIELLQDYIKDLFKEFNKKIIAANSFIYDQSSINFHFSSDKEKCKTCLMKNFHHNVEINTVHAVKGETHAATLFMESFFNRKYESDIVYEIFLGNTIVNLIKNKQKEIQNLNNEITNLNGGTGTKTKLKKADKLNREIDKIKQYSKIIFVALSRPTSIVGYAISKKRFDKYLKDKLAKNEWEIVYI